MYTDEHVGVKKQVNMLLLEVVLFQDITPINIVSS